MQHQHDRGRRPEGDGDPRTPASAEGRMITDSTPIRLITARVLPETPLRAIVPYNLRWLTSEFHPFERYELDDETIAKILAEYKTLTLRTSEF